MGEGRGGGAVTGAADVSLTGRGVKEGVEGGGGGGQWQGLMSPGQEWA